MDSWQFADPEVLRVWLWIIFKANFSDSFFTVRSGSGERIVKVKRGQFIFGRKSAASELKLHESKVYRIVQAMAVDGCISIESNSLFSIITVNKYDDYQSNTENEEAEIIQFRTGHEQPMNNPRTSREQPADNVRTLHKNVKKVNNVKKVKKEQPTLFRDCPFLELDLFKLQFFGIEKYQDFDLSEYHENLLNWSNSKGEKKLDWIATAKNWMNRDLKNKNSNNGADKNGRYVTAASAKQASFDAYVADYRAITGE